MAKLLKAAPKLELDDFFSPIYERGPDGLPQFRMLVDGRWVEAEDRSYLEVSTPIDGSSIARVPQSSTKDVKKAITAAYRRRGTIRAIPGIERVEIFEVARRILLAHKGDLARTIMLEAGKPLRDAEGEVSATAERLKLTLQEAREIFGEYIPGDWSEETSGKFALVIREPVGVIAAIAPFNYPLFIAAAKIIPAILAGNTVVAKASSEDPLALLLFARILEEAGLPKGVLNVITGRGSSVGDALVGDERVSLVTFTGSTEVGRRLASLAALKKQHLELGGKGMAIVLDDAELDLAAKKCVEGALKNAGQRCDAISAILVMENVADEFVEKVLHYAREWKYGDPRRSDVRMGPLINEAAAKRVNELVKDAVKKGARLLLGGGYEGCYHEPTVLDRVPLTAKIAWEETFGPVITILRIKDEDEAIEIGRKSRYGLDSCIFTNNFYRMWKLAKRLEVGEVTINDLPRHGVGYFPFGGSKESGIGREGLGYSIDEMTDLKTIVFNLEPAGLGKEVRTLRL